MSSILLDCCTAQAGDAELPIWPQLVLWSGSMLATAFRIRCKTANDRANSGRGKARSFILSNRVMLQTQPTAGEVVGWLS